MTFDLSRITFDPRKDFLGVVMQQGRVQLDADWNEWLCQFTRRVQAGTLDVLGRAVVPRETPAAFRIEITGEGLSIGPGRIYLDGLLAENHGRPADTWNRRLAELTGTASLLYAVQPYLPNPPPLPDSDSYLVYLDVWQRDVTYLQDPDLVEKAVGVDSTGRRQTVWQVKLLSGVDDIDCATRDEDIPDWVAETRPSAGRLSTSTGDLPGEPDPCDVPPAAGYTGRENQLYRIEIHAPGRVDGATFKWSRDNVTVASLVTHINPARNRLTVESIGRDDVLRFNDGDWVEITDDRLELHNLPGELRRIRLGGGVDDITRTIELDSPVSNGLFPVNAQNQTDRTRHTRIYRWDQSGQVRREDGSIFYDLDDPTHRPGAAIPVPPNNTRLFLENGILVQFRLDPDGGEFKSGDHWMFAARSVDAGIDILTDAPPHGIHHHYAPLAIVRRPDVVLDLRTPLNPVVGSVQVCSVLHTDINGRARALRSGQEIPLDHFVQGLAVLIRQAVDPNSVNDASLFVTTEVPYRLPPPYASGHSGAVVAYQPVVLPAEVASISNGVLHWRPLPQTVTFLGDILQQDVSRLGNVQFEREFDVFDHGGPPSRWGLGPGNVVVQTEAAAGTAIVPSAPALPTTAVHRYLLKENASYVGLGVELTGEGTVGLVYNWQDEENFSLFFVRQLWQSIGFSGAIANVTVSHTRIREGEPDREVDRQTALADGQETAIRISLDVKKTAGTLQFGGRANFQSGFSAESQDLGFDDVATDLLAGTRLGVLTAGLGTARFTRLQVNYPDEVPATLIPSGLTARLLGRLILKRSLLTTLSGTLGSPLGGVFAGPVPEPDFETWFWLVPPSAGYYGYPYGDGGGYRGIGSGRLWIEVPL